MTDATSEHGVYYQVSDYIGAGKRFVIDLVDVLVAILLSIAASTVLSFIIWDDQLAAPAVLTTLIAIWFGYFVLLKSSRFRTIGYVLTGARLVNLQGQRPSIGSLIIRSLFAALGPLNLLFDLFWIPSDPCRQALRDKFAHTYVIRRDAWPAGAGPVGYGTYTILGWSFLFCEVKPSQPAGAP